MFKKICPTARHSHLSKMAGVIKIELFIINISETTKPFLTKLG
jgi:hypothetical protein